MTSKSRRRGASYRPSYDTSPHLVWRRTKSPSPPRANNSDSAFVITSQHGAHDENVSKRVKREGDFYRPDRSRQDRDVAPSPPPPDQPSRLSTLRKRPLPPYEPPPDFAFSLQAYNQRRQAIEPQRESFVERNWPAELSKSAKRQAKIDDLTDRIHVLREEVESPELPKDQKNEKEAELAKCQSILQNAKDRSKIDRRYHHVRTVERMHASRVLTKLRKQERLMNTKINISKRRRPELENQHTMADDPVSEDEDEDGGVRLWASDPTPTNTAGKDPDIWLERVLEPKLKREYEELQQQIHDAEVDYNYCCFAPHKETYICLFPTDERQRIMRPRKKGVVNQRNGPDPEDLVQKDQAAGILRTSTGAKPPFWSRVEDRMRRGALHELRDGKLNAMSGQQSLLELGGRNAADERVAAGLKRRHSWMDDTEMALEDLDTEHEFETDDEL